ncbi:MAG TPA: hypothetical protein VIH57_20910, partial [Bacteroidales bacterium]
MFSFSMKMYMREQALEIMNKWGTDRIPFLFVIDFEMEKIRLFRTDTILPGGIRTSFPGKVSDDAASVRLNDFRFEKIPVSFPVYETAF